MNHEKNFGFHQEKNLTQQTVSIRWVDFFAFLAIFGANSNFLEKRYYKNFILYQAEEVVKKSEG